MKEGMVGSGETVPQIRERTAAGAIDTELCRHRPERSGRGDCIQVFDNKAPTVTEPVNFTVIVRHY